MIPDDNLRLQRLQTNAILNYLEYWILACPFTQKVHREGGKSLPAVLVCLERNQNCNCVNAKGKHEFIFHAH